jgi:hypothetical protein
MNGWESKLAILPHFTQPLLVHIDPDRVPIMAGRHFAEIEFDRIERLVDAAMVSDVF